MLPYYGGYGYPYYYGYALAYGYVPMATGTVAPTMAMAATTRAIGTQGSYPIVVITIGMVVTTQIVGTPTVENRAALAYRRKTAFAVFLFACLQ